MALSSPAIDSWRSGVDDVGGAGTGTGTGGGGGGGGGTKCNPSAGRCP